MPISIRFLIAALLLFPLNAGLASPLAGGPCGGTGTLAEYIALGDAGCYLGEVRIYDIEVSEPYPADLSKLTVSASNSNGFLILAAYEFQQDATLTVSWDDLRPATASWRSLDTGGAFYPHTLSGTPTLTGTVTMQAARLVEPYYSNANPAAAFINLAMYIQEAPQAPSLTLLRGSPQATPEPNAFLPLLVIGMVLLARYGVRNSSSR